MSENTDHGENRIFPRVMFAAPQSGSGKTVITCGFLEILKERGIKAVSFKCGPDYIDPLFHSYLTGKKGTSLDSFFLGRDGVLSLFKKKVKAAAQAQDAPIAVTEGVMGYYDGLAGTSLTASSWDIADCLDCPVILIMDVKKEGAFLEKKLEELLDRVPESHIRGVICNRATPKEADTFRPRAEELGLKFYGYVPECPEADIKSRHLGLVLPSVQDKFQEKIYAFSGIIKETTDIDGIIELSRNAAELTGPVTEYAAAASENTLPKGRIAVASDEAFCFTYDDNLDLLREMGYELIPFSPIHDTALPQDIRAIILDGGYPELYAKELSSNIRMLQAMSNAFGKVKIMAECGGFLYLHRTLEGMDGTVYPMAGCIDASAYRTSHSSRFGYISLYPGRTGEGHRCDKPADAGPSSDRGLIKAHEFHYWESTAPGNDLCAKKPISGRSWECMYQSPELLAGFPHLYYRSGPEFIRSFLEGET